MNVSCEKFLKRLIDKNITKGELRFDICRGLRCEAGDVVNVVLGNSDQGIGNRSAKCSCGSFAGQFGEKLAR